MIKCGQNLKREIEKGEEQQTINEQTIKKFPWGVKVLSVYFYITAFLAIMNGLMSLYTGGVESKDFRLFMMGIFHIGLGVFGVFIGRGLWEGRHWAKIFAIIWAGLGTLRAMIILCVFGKEGTYFFVISILSLGLNLVIVIYLLLTPFPISKTSKDREGGEPRSREEPGSGLELRN